MFNLSQILFQALCVQTLCWGLTLLPFFQSSWQVGEWVLYCPLFFFLFRAAPAAYGISWARGWIRAAAAGLRHRHGNVGVQATFVTYTMAHDDAGSLSPWARAGIEPASSWFLVDSLTTVPRREPLVRVLNPRSHNGNSCYYSLLMQEETTAVWLNIIGAHSLGTRHTVTHFRCFVLLFRAASCSTWKFPG